jgi:hypothetical protein
MAAVTLLACRDGGGRDAEVQRADSTGVEIVTSPASTLARPLDWHIDEHPRATIGATDDSANANSHAAHAFRLRDGSVLVVDDALTSSGPKVRILVFDSAGHYLRSIGRIGKGPGEFNGIAAVGMWAGDSIFVFDQRLGMLHLFTMAGAFVRRASLTGFPAFELDPVGSAANGSFVVSRTRHTPTAVMRDYHTVGGDGTVSPAFAKDVRIGPRRVEQTIWDEVGVDAVNQRNIYCTEPERYEIRQHTMDGRLARIMRVSLAPRAATQEEVTRHKERRVALVRARLGTGSADWMKAELDKLRAPGLLPTFADLIADAEGNLWAQELRPVGDEPQRWLVFDPGGALLGVMSFPADWEIHQIGADFILVATHDSEGLERLELRGLSRGR